MLRLVVVCSVENKDRFCNTIALVALIDTSIQAKGGFQEELCAYNERRRVNLKFCLADFVYLIHELCGNCFI